MNVRVGPEVLWPLGIALALLAVIVAYAVMIRIAILHPSILVSPDPYAEHEARELAEGAPIP